MIRFLFILIGLILVVTITISILRVKSDGDGNSDDQFTLGAGDYEFSVNVNGDERVYFVHVPASYDKTPTPLVLNFHGGGGSPEGHKEITEMDDTSDKGGFIVVYPRGTRPDGDSERQYQRFWNVKRGPTGEFNTEGAVIEMDEEKFVLLVLDDLKEKFSIDEKRVYAAGFSNGAILTNQLGCDLSDKIAAIAPIGAPYWGFPEACNLMRPMPVIYFHGTADFCAPFNGGSSQCELGLANQGRVFPSAEETVEFWKGKNACDNNAEITYDRGDVTCQTFTCAQSEVVFCRIEGGGHTWPGGQEYVLPGFDVGKTTQDINANEAMWEFFKKYNLN
jgi:polyhydroxybutyrate depolymerase